MCGGASSAPSPRLTLLRGIGELARLLLRRQRRREPRLRHRRPLRARGRDDRLARRSELLLAVDLHRQLVALAAERGDPLHPRLEVLDEPHEGVEVGAVHVEQLGRGGSVHCEPPNET